MREKFDVVIIGGGMGGLLLTLLLARQGRTVAVVERQARLQPIARGELLQPNGLRILDQLGLLDALKTLPVHQAYQFHFHRIGRGRLCSADYRTLPPPYNYTLITLPHHLLNLLLQQLQKTERVKIFTGTEFRGLLFEDGRVSGIRAVQNGTVIELWASIVVGSDGARSQVREAMRIPHSFHEYREAYLTMIVPRPEGFEEDARYYVGTAEILGLFPVSEKELYLFYMVRVADLQKIKQGRIETLCRAISRIDPTLTEPLQSITAWDQTGYMPCIRVRARRWTIDGGVLIGDAAHAMNPHVAQGRNQAMEDAVLLAEVIQDAFDSRDFSSDRLGRYEGMRRPTVERLQRLGDELTFLWNTGFPPLAWIRDQIFLGMNRHPEIRKSVVLTISGLDVRPLGLPDRLRVFLP